jgi:hypothetical protein
MRPWLEAVAIAIGFVLLGGGLVWFGNVHPIAFLWLMASSLFILAVIGIRQYR